MAVPIPYMIGNALTTRLIHRLGDWRLMVTGQLLNSTGVTLVLSLSLAGVHKPLALALPMMLVGIGHGLMIPPMLSRAVGLIASLAGTAAAFSGALQQALGALGGYVVGMAPEAGAMPLGLTMAVPSLCALLSLFLNWRQQRRTT